MSGYDGSIKIKTEISTKQAEVQLSALQNRIVKTADKIDSLRSKMGSLKDTKIPTQEYSEISAQIEKAEQKFNKLLEKQEQMQREGKDNGAAWDRLTYQIEEVGNEIRYAKGELQDLVTTGKAFTLGSNTEEYAKLGQQLQYAEKDMEVFAGKHDILTKKLGGTSSSYRKLSSVASKAFQTAGKWTKVAKDHVAAFGRTIKNIAQKFLPSFNKGAKKSNGLLGTFASRLKGISLSLLVFNWITRAFNAVVKPIKEGYQNFYNGNERFKKSVDSLKASAATLKNSLAAAFSPLVTIAIPYIQKVIDYMNMLMDSIGQFIAAITGQKTYTKAIKQTTDAIEDETKASNKQLSSLDKLNNLTSQNGSDGNTGSGTMFEEVPISDKFKNFAQWLKDMWEDSDFYELGNLLGEKLKNALDNIPWDGIKEKARKIGKSLASLINGFIEVEGLGYSIGKTLAEAMNTAFEFLNAFFHELNWTSIGKFIAESLNGFFENIDWELIKDTFITGVKGLADDINSFIENFNWDNVSDTISNIANIITESVYTFFSTVDWGKLGEELGSQLKKTIEKIDWEMLGKAIGSIIQAALDFVVSFVKEQDMSTIANAIKDTLKGFLEEVDMSELATVLLSLLAAKLALFATKTVFTNAAGAISKALLSALSSVSISWVPTILIAGATAIIGFNVGKWLGEQLFPEDKQWYEDFSWFGEGGFFDTVTNDLQTTFDAIIAMMTDFENNPVIAALSNVLAGPIASAAVQISEHAEEIKNKFEEIKLTAGQKFAEMKGNITEKIAEIKANITLKLGEIKTKWAEGWNSMRAKLSSVIAGIKRTIGSAFEWISEKVEFIKEKLEGLKNKISGTSSRGLSPSYSVPLPGKIRSSMVMTSLSEKDIPAYATGQVIPRTMKQHLAILGDNNQETEVVSPLSTIEQAVENVIAKLGMTQGSNDQAINLNLTLECEGYQLLHIMQKLDGEYFKQHGKHALA